MANLRRQNPSDDDVQEISPMKMSTKRKPRPSAPVKVESDEEDRKLEDDSSSHDDNFEEIQGRRIEPGKRGKRGAQKKTRRKKLKA